MWALCGTTHSKRPQAVKQEAQEVSSYGQREAVENFCIEIAHRHQLDLLSVRQKLGGLPGTFCGARTAACGAGVLARQRSLAGAG
jgi:hypothetical protein